MSHSARFHHSLIFVVTVAWLLAAPMLANAESMLVSAEWVKSRLQLPGLVLLHVGEEETYNQGHLPGAVHVNTHADLSHPGSHSAGSLILEMPEITQLEKTLSALGIANDSSVVVYWSDDDITNAARALYTLRWAGLGNQSRILDGGLAAWKDSDFALSRAIPKVRPTKLKIEPNTALVVNSRWVQDNKDNASIALVDGRSRAFFDGIMKSRGIAGHIPGAGSAPWTDLVDSELRLHDAKTLRRVFAHAGVSPGDTVVAYCHIGQYASLVLLAATTLGHEVKLYDGAFQDWAARGLPVTTTQP